MNPSEAEPSVQELKHLEKRSFDQILAWLESALKGKAVLPLVVPDESPELPILRHERVLGEITRSDLREACRTLVRRFAKLPEGKDNYVAALLRLASGLHLKDLVSDLHALANAPLFDGLSENQMKSVIFALVDMRAPVALEFWKEMAARHPQTLGVITISGLLGHGYNSAMSILPLLADTDPQADSLYVVFDQHARLLNASELQKMVAAARESLDSYPPKIRSAIEEWITEQQDTKPKSAAVSKHSSLDAALAAHHSRSGRVYERKPIKARLIAA